MFVHWESIETRKKIINTMRVKFYSYWLNAWQKLKILNENRERDLEIERHRKKETKRKREIFTRKNNNYLERYNTLKKA